VVGAEKESSNLLARSKTRVILYPYVVMVTQIMSTRDEVGGAWSLIELEGEKEGEREGENTKLIIDSKSL
jgi:hypothetical protein